MQTRVEGKKTPNDFKQKHRSHEGIGFVFVERGSGLDFFSVGKIYQVIRKQRGKTWEEPRWCKLGQWHVNLGSLKSRPQEETKQAN